MASFAELEALLKSDDVTITRKKIKSSSGSDSETTESTETKPPTVSSDRIATFRKEHSVFVDGCSKESYETPIFSFHDSGIDSRLLESVKSFEKPTPIQSQCIPILLNKRDCVGVAKTGSGKTIGFGLPGLALCLEAKNVKGPKMLVIAPTRELASQSFEVLKEAGAFVNLSCVCIYGGVPKREQIKLLKSKPDVLVATPGRLLGLIEENGENLVSLDSVKYLVLDEADRMLDLGFIPDVRRIVQYIGKRQTVMFSATWPEEVRNLSDEFLQNACKVVIGSVEATANRDVKQIVEVVDYEKRNSLLLKRLGDYTKGKKDDRVLVFVLYKKEANFIERFLSGKGYRCLSISGDKSQYEREEALDAFKSGKVPILVATDVAARGLHIDQVELVFNYSFPLTIEDYIHRIGRTGRAGSKGIAHTFFCSRDKGLSGNLINVLKEAGAEVPEDLLQFGTAVKRKEHKMYGAHFKSFDGPVPQSKHVKF